MSDPFDVCAPPSAAHASTADHPAARIFRRVMRGHAGAALRMDGCCRETVGHAAPFTLVVRDPAVLRELVLRRDPLRLADAYFSGAIDVEGDLYAALTLKDHLEALDLRWRDRLALFADARHLRVNGDAGGPGPAASLRSRIAHRFAHRHSRRSDRAAIAFHYDVSNEFYRLWLDDEMVYSCAYFGNDAQESLDDAQRRKLEHICRKLRLAPGERLLDIGSGWGALLCWAARHHGVQAHGITLSRRQYDHVRERVRVEGLADRVSVELRDYRDLPGEALYDKVASVGMFEHVGLANLPTYFATVRRLLKPGGLFLNHGITHDEDGWSKTVATRFINRYVFPDGELDRVSNIQLAMERAGFEIHDVEGLRPHYALTLRRWVGRLEARRDEALALVGEPTYRVWRLYMAACALEFESGGTGIYQVVASRRDRGRWPLPWTRADLYAGRDGSPQSLATACSTFTATGRDSVIGSDRGT